MSDALKDLASIALFVLCRFVHPKVNQAGGYCSKDNRCCNGNVDSSA